MITQTIKLSDLFLIAYLMCKNHEISSTNRTGEKRIEFIFERNEDIQKDIDDFLDDKNITINLRAYTKKYKDLLFYAHNPNFTKKTEEK